jgi:hypothetical protein
MQDQPAPSRDSATAFTLREAAAELGISLNTLRRRISAGQIDAERVHRPQGHVWQVYLHRAATQEHRSDGTVQRDGATVQQPPTAPAPAEAMVSLIQTTIGTVLGPLVGQLDAQRQTIERQAGEIAELREDRGRLTAEVEALKVSQAQQDAHPGPVAPIPATDARVPLTARLRALAPWVFGVLMIIIVGVMLWTR